MATANTTSTAESLLGRVKNLVNDPFLQAQWAEKKWVWVTDKDEGYLSGWIVTEEGDNAVIQLSNDTKRNVNINDCEKMNPPKFDKVEDMADLTYLNEASVVHNLRLRYFSNLVYTYSGLFLVAVNPYKKLPIYTDDVVKMYRGKKRAEMAPHIYAISDAAYFDMLQDKENQSILITGESGAGKTENTKKVIQYFASVAGGTSAKNAGTLEAQILQANPILESFGNAQTIRNNNSSRFGKFIRLEFSPTGHIVGANIERYLLEKSRVTHQTAKERNYHVFYQLIRGASKEMREKFLLTDNLNDYRFLKSSNKNIEGVDDATDFKSLSDSMNIMQISADEQTAYFRVIAAILHLGGIQVSADKEDQANLVDSSNRIVEQVCHVLGIPVAEFIKALLRPKIKAGRDWVVSARNCEQVLYSVESLARSIYERMFGSLVDRINQAIYTPSSKSSFIGVLDIAGFEIFEQNSFEQLLINYTNEKLQQFFNHHMFILEQEEYRREGIEWKFIDFGLDLQPTIDLIEKTSPIGILSCLDEECVMPKATDKTFQEKLNQFCKGKSTKYEVPRFNMGFILHHYAGKVEYSSSNWLDKNKDPLNENITRLLAKSTEKYIGELFVDYLGDPDEPLAAGKQGMVAITKKGAFRTVAQRHKEQLSSLMSQLYTTEPHFVRCILPNEDKKPGKLNTNLVLDQLRCNGVLEGIRICRAGFPNRLLFADFRQRYEVLCPGVIPNGFMDGRKASQALLETLNLDKNQYRIGSSKVFFRAGVLAELEERRDERLAKLVTKIQALIRGCLARRGYTKKNRQLAAIKIIQKNARIYVTLREWSWWRLFCKVKPLLNVARTDEELRKREDAARAWEEKAIKEAEERAKADALRSQLESQKRQIEEALLQEKNAASDQAEILARTQEREVELSERLKELALQLEDRETQNEQLLASKKKLETEIREARDLLSDGGANLARLEKIREQIEGRVKTLESELSASAAECQKLEGDRSSLQNQLSELQKLLKEAGDREAELRHQNTKLKSQIAELEAKLESEEDQRKQLEQRRSLLEGDLKNTRDGASDLARIRSELETVIKRKETEILELNEALKRESSEKDSVDRQRRDIQGKLNATEGDLENERAERDKITKLKIKVEKELEQVHQLMAEKGNEAGKADELRRIRESELSDLKNLLSGTQAEAEESRRKTTQMVESLRAELDAAQQDGSTAAKARVAAERQIADLRTELEAAEDQKGRLDKSRRQLESDLQAARARFDESDSSVLELKNAKETLEKQLAILSAKAEEAEGNFQRADRERQSLQKQAESLREEVEEEVNKRNVLDGQKKKLAAEIQELMNRLEEEDESRQELNKKLTAKSSELEVLKESYNRDAKQRGAELEESFRKATRELTELQARFAELERGSSGLEKVKARLSGEIEDLKVEIDREHNAARLAEKTAKDARSELAAANQTLEAERRQREVAESNQRKLQSQIETLNLELDNRSHQIAQVQKSKNELETELKALIDEIGDGGKNVHELEKAKRRLESRVEELQTQLDEEEGLRIKAADAKRTIELDLADIRKKAEADLAAKDALMEETRRMLMKEVNSIGEQLDEALSQKGEILKAKKRLEEQVEELTSRADSTSRNKDDQEKARKKAEASARESAQRLEDEERARRNFEELAQRHEKKANSLQAEIERLDGQVELLDRTRKQLEKKVDELTNDLEGGGEDSRRSLLEAKKRYEKEIQALREALEEEQDARSQMAARPGVNPNEIEKLRSEARADLEGKIEKMEESRRALLAAQRIAAQEVEDKVKEISNLDKQKKLLQDEISSLKSRLEAEVVARGDEAAKNRKLATDIKEMQLRIDAESSKSRDASDLIEGYKSKADASFAKLESAELARIKAEKNQSALLLQMKELEDSLAESLKDRRAAEDRVKSLEEQLIDLQEQQEDNALEIADHALIKRKLQDEIDKAHERHKADLEEREALVDDSRRKYQKEIKQLMAELEIEKNNGLTLKETNKELEHECEEVSAKLESELRSATTWKKEKERLESRVEELTRLYMDGQNGQDELQNQINTLLTQVRDLRASQEDGDATRSALEKAKRSLEQRLEELGEQMHASDRARGDLSRTLHTLETSTNELREQVEELTEEARVASDKQRRAEQTANDALSDLNKERTTTMDLEKTKVSLEKQVKELGARILDMEAAVLQDRGGGTRRLEGRLDELATQLDNATREKNELGKEARKNDRTVKDLQFQLTERDKAKTRFAEEIDKLTDKCRQQKAQIEELESAEANLQLAKRRAEREYAEQKERSLRLEKEVENLKRRFETLSPNK
ncbi:hypothetical protein SmJEL517_g02611 [Synchytrium microbalum]|uniref:Myosin motor domain-containing protein n=1 Tax=Synchytrium microbalum TaxID=1806994 RepID=A0A507CA23_9FUNG|nr:uncharacterized protein SmJEL517_g02611 [Synchytrium microbalum]TPX34846.1 hypothetical protein SmJEL517_g02611 [Synchytrium microbalum]